MIEILCRYPELKDQMVEISLKWQYKFCTKENKDLIKKEMDKILKDHIVKLREEKIREICL